MYNYCISCSLMSLLPLLYLLVIRNYFLVVSEMSDDREELRGNLNLLKNEELEISMQKTVYSPM